MNLYIAHAGEEAQTFWQGLDHFFQNPVAALVLLAIILGLFLMASLYVLQNYTSLNIADFSNKSRNANTKRSK